MRLGWPPEAKGCPIAKYCLLVVLAPTIWNVVTSIPDPTMFSLFESIRGWTELLALLKDDSVALGKRARVLVRCRPLADELASDLPSSGFRLISFHAHRVCRDGPLERRVRRSGLANLGRTGAWTTAGASGFAGPGFPDAPFFPARDAGARNLARARPDSTVGRLLE